MRITEDIIESLLFKTLFQQHRFTQDSPIYPDVWLHYFKNVDQLDSFRLDLILTPHKNSSAGELYQQLDEQLSGVIKNADMATNGDTVVVKLTFRELITIALPMTNWWKNYLLNNQGQQTPDYDWLQTLVGAFHYASNREFIGRQQSLEEAVKIFPMVYRDFYPRPSQSDKVGPPSLWSVSRNREALITVEKSVPATKADSCRKVFSIDGAGITWAILDSGIDVTHDAFRKTDPKTAAHFPAALGEKNDPQSNRTRVIATYDFTRFRSILAELNKSDFETLSSSIVGTEEKSDQALTKTDKDSFLADIHNGLKKGRSLDWTVVAPLLRIPHNVEDYEAPEHNHGTHVAGIIGASTDINANKEILGMCPAILLYDIRVLDDQGRGDEFNILAALQFVRWLNSKSDSVAVHGVNLSFSMIHEVASYACGQTPVCDACTKLVKEGTVVVAAAGNLGQTMYQAKDSTLR